MNIHDNRSRASNGLQDAPLAHNRSNFNNRTVNMGMSEAPKAADFTNHNTSVLPKKSLFERIISFFKPTTTRWPESVVFKLTDGTALTVSSKMLPKAPHNAACTEGTVIAIIQEKIQRGELLFNTVMQGKSEIAPPNLEDISNLMWYLNVHAEAQEREHFSSGAITIKDPEFKLLKYLDKCAEVYTRKSSHVKEHTNYVDEKLQTSGDPRGIDIHSSRNLRSLENFKEMLPNGKQTLLLHPIFKDNEPYGPGENMLLLKQELEGARASRPFGSERNPPYAPKSRPLRTHDLVETLLHGFTFIRTRGTVDSGRKESIPSKYIKAWKAIIKTASLGQGSVALPTGITVADMEAGLAKGGGIHIMYRLTNNLIKHYGELSKPLSSNPILAGVREMHVQNLLSQLNVLKARLERQFSLESLAYRIGNEVILFN